MLVRSASSSVAFVLLRLIGSSRASSMGFMRCLTHSRSSLADRSVYSPQNSYGCSSFGLRTSQSSARLLAICSALTRVASTGMHSTSPSGQSVAFAAPAPVALEFRALAASRCMNFS